jgi:hypothetical protein
MKKSSIILSLAGILLLTLVCAASLFYLISSTPSVGAQGAEVLRSVLGDRPVAALEMIYLRVGDSIQQAKYGLGLEQAQAPWEVLEYQPPTSVGFEPTGTLVADAVSKTKQPVESIEESTPATGLDQGSGLPSVTPEPPTPTVEPMPIQWFPSSIDTSGSLEGEGEWSPYFENAGGETVAYRTFVQPDPDRPYSIVAIVAFDLSKIKLNFVLGFEEPYNPEAPKRSGKIPEEHKIPGILLAAFNGGFKAQHGGSGAMQSGLVVLPPRDGLGTVAMYQDGSLELGEWGAEINQTDDMAAWRQNGPLVVQDGEINPRIYNNDPKDWGYTVDDVSPTLRSALGISEDQHTLYYLTGPKLTMEALAMSLKEAGVWDGIQLDINNYWVHFVVYPTDLNELQAEPLLPELMIENLDRYLYAFGRDYFYVTPRE